MNTERSIWRDAMAETETTIAAKETKQMPIEITPAPKTVFQGGSLTVEELAQLCDVDVAIAQRVIAGLVKRGLIEGQS